MPEVERGQRPEGDDQVSGPVPEQQASVAQALAEAWGRIATLESEQIRLLELRAEELDRQNKLLRSNPQVQAGQAVSATARTETLTPAYLARALVAVEEQVLMVEAYAAQGDNSSAAQAKVLAATTTCSTLSRLCDDDRFHEILMRMQPEADEPSANLTKTVTEACFKEAEVQILELVGLSRSLAEQHVGAAIDAFNRDPSGSIARLQKPMTFLRDVRALRDAACQSAELISAGIRRQRSRDRWRKLLTLGLGGTLLVTANAIGAMLIGDGGVAASGAIGSAAVGAALPLSL